MNYILETEKIKLRELTMDDTSFIIELVNSPGWLKYIGNRNIKTIEQATTYLENGPIKSYRENGFGLWLVETRDDKNPIGMCGLLRRDYLDHPDIGFAFLPECLGKGFGFEASAATLALAKDKLKLPVICAITMPSNNASIKLLEKIGLKFMKQVSPPGSQEELLLYQINLSQK
jgi:RimJ/RimL family protein N-acetyltransferase